ncbi:MAG: HU family DNA-binding protein [Chloroflexota bacterium]|nr:HU family DNA-binding protein [Chloroflexota bacterium]
MANTIHKRELTALIAKREGWTLKDASSRLDAVIGGLQEALADESKVVITGFGTFGVKQTGARKIRVLAGPNAGEMVDVPSRKKVYFKPGAVLSASIEQ